MSAYNPPHQIGDNYVCTGCGGQFKLHELKHCSECGYYYCPDCYRKHQCIDLGGGVAAIRKGDPFTPSEKIILNYFDPIKVRKFCANCGNVFHPSELIQCQDCGMWLCRECGKKHTCDPVQRKKWLQVHNPKKFKAENKNRNLKPFIVVGIICAVIIILVIVYQ
ncbi:MAG: endonuclease Q family protein [Methanocorpusculum sp.]|jgi:hypothetical protein|nr:endonuclease Q family protein [Methanocorpusculum sp.]